MSLSKELPCPHCGAPISLGVMDYMPSRVPTILCRACSHRWRPPFVMRFVAVLLFGIFVVVEKELLKPLAVWNPETVQGVVGEGVAILLLFSSAWLFAALICRPFVKGLVP